jgi:hypothetical protein
MDWETTLVADEHVLLWVAKISEQLSRVCMNQPPATYD